MILVRLISLIFVAAALMVLGADFLAWLETRAFDPRSFVGLWQLIDPGSGAAAQSWANGLPDILSTIANAILGAWAFVALGIPGVVLAIIVGQR